jgi:hemerythrin-like domain-containing protein
MQDIMRYMSEHSDRFHHPKEDLIFAKLLRRDPDVRADVEDLIEEHFLIRIAGREFAALLRTSGVDSVYARERLGIAGSAYVRAQRDHMNKEERNLFPLAAQLFTEKDWQDLDEASETIDDPLFDEMTADDYQRLYRLIAERSESGATGP